MIEFVRDPAAVYAAPAPVTESVGTPAALHAAPASVIESVGTPVAAPVNEYVDPATAVTDTAPVPVIEYGHPAHAVFRGTSSSDRVRDMCTRCHLCDTCASD